MRPPHSPRALIQAVKRNLTRFPEDFMFQLTDTEFKNLKSQIVTSSWGGLRRATPYAFTEQGVAMLSSVLRSERAIQVNIAIMRAFVRLKEMIASHKDLARKLTELEKKYDKQFAVVFEALRQLMEPPKTKQRSIGCVFPVGMREKKMILGITSFVPTIWRAADVCCGKEGECAHPGGGGASI